MNACEKSAKQQCVQWVRDLRNTKRARLTSKNEVLLYGHRPMTRPDLLYLSPYEFTTHWEAQLLRYPKTLAEDESGNCEAKLTAKGKRKIKIRDHELVAGEDYIVKESGGDDWAALEDVGPTAAIRHEWILRRRRRPMAPHFKGCPLPKHKAGSSERNAQIIMTYFHPWTLRPDWGHDHVPTLDKLRGGDVLWQDALTYWLDGRIISEESKRYVSNFISIHRLRPGENEDNELANPDDMIEDEELFVTKDMLNDVLETRIGGKKQNTSDLDALGDGHHINSTEAIRLGRDVWCQSSVQNGTSTQPSGTTDRAGQLWDEEQVKLSLKSAQELSPPV